MPMAKREAPTQEEAQEQVVLYHLIVAREEGLGGLTLDSLAKKTGMTKAGVVQRLKISIDNRLVRKTGSTYHVTSNCPELPK